MQSDLISVLAIELAKVRRERATAMEALRHIASMPVREDRAAVMHMTATEALQEMGEAP